MRNVFTIAALLLMIAMTAARPAIAQTAPTPPNASLLHLAETAQRNVPRDTLRANLAADVTDADPAKVQAEINRRMTAALARIKVQPDITVETTGYSVRHEQIDKAPARWHGVQSLSLTGKDFAGLLTLVGALQQQGLVVTGLAPELSRDARRSLEDGLTDEALARLRQRADRFAGSLGTKVQAYRDVEIGNASPPPSPMRMMAMAASAPSEVPPPVAEPGEETVSVTVRMAAELASRP